jgi:hypothetical protein
MEISKLYEGKGLFMNYLKGLLLFPGSPRAGGLWFMQSWMTQPKALPVCCTWEEGKVSTLVFCIIKSPLREHRLSSHCLPPTQLSPTLQLHGILLTPLLVKIHI